MQPLARRLRPLPKGAPTLTRLPHAYGEIAGTELLLAVGGVGRGRAEAAADQMLRQWKPDLILMAGVAGALAGILQLAELVVADRVYAETVTLRPDLVLPEALPGGIAGRRGALLSSDRILVTVEEKRFARNSRRSGRDPSPLAVEMETPGLAAAAKKHGIPWGAVRAVSDTSEEALPLDFNRFRGADGDLPVSRVALAAIANPLGIPGLIRLGGNTSTAAARLSEYVVAWVTAGCPSVRSGA